MALEVLAISPTARSLEPRCIFAIPTDSGGEAVRELPPGFPAELLRHFRTVDGVTEVVAGTVSYELDESLGLAEERQDHSGNIDVTHFRAAADVVDLAVVTLVKDDIERATVIVDVDPVADVLALAVHRQRLVGCRLRNHQGNEFLGKLVGAVIVGTAGDQSRQSV